MIDPTEAFKTAMLDHGITPPPNLIGDSTLHRFYISGDRKGSLNGAYTLHLDARPSGWAMWFRTGISFTWTLSGEKQPMTVTMKKQIEYARQVRQQEQDKAHQEAAQKARWIWGQSTIIATLKTEARQHRYLVAKRIQAHGARLYGSALVIPLVDETGTIVNVQFIQPDGQKRFLSGGRKKGCFATIGGITETILICEGWATGASLHEQTGHHVAVAMDAGNLKPVSEVIRKQHPTAKIIICADNDTVGKEKATIAAFACTGLRLLHQQQGKTLTTLSVLAGWFMDNVVDLFLAEKPKQPDNESIKLFDDEGGKKSQSTLLIEIGQQFKLFHDDNRDAYAEVTGNFIYPLRSKDFKELLGHHFFNLTGKGCNTNAVSDAINTLEAIAKHTGELHPVNIRIYNDAKRILIDLSDKERRLIAVDPNGWQVKQTSSVKFIAKRGMTALPTPSGKGDISLLSRYLNINCDDLPLIVGWILCAIGGVKPYPILILQGEQGSGKSTTSRVIRALVDPSSVPLRSPPRDTKDLLVSAGNTHVVTLDNLSGLSPEISDCLCRLSTGGGHDVRQLYSDTDQILLDIQKPVIINGIDDIATRPDLAERALIINLPEIKPDNRRSENEFWRDFELDKPVIFAGLLDCLVSGLTYRDSVVLKEKPRMADVAVWITACEKAYQPERTFIEAHRQNQREAIELGIESSPLGTAIMDLMANKDEWTGTPTLLLKELETIAWANQAKSRAWPQSTKGLRNSIRRLMPSFRKIGIFILQNPSGDRFYKITKVTLQPPKPPETPKTSNGAAFSPGAYRADSDNRADSFSNRPTTNPATAHVLAVWADKAVKNDLPIFVDEGEI